MVLEKDLVECFFLMENIFLEFGKKMNFLVRGFIVIMISLYIKVIFRMEKKMAKAQNFILIIVIIKGLLEII